VLIKPWPRLVRARPTNSPMSDCYSEPLPIHQV
jgi:hypothetical protein